jgi:hypothetical protein
MRSGIRPHIRVDGDLFDVQIDLLSQDEVRPGESATIGISFLSPELVHSRVRVGDAYSVFEGAREIGQFVVQTDVWKDPARLIQVGREYTATVVEVGWTAAQVALENGWTAALNSRDVGLAPWAEIGQALHEGAQLRVRVEAVDAIKRTVTLSPQPSRSAG